MRSCIRIVAWVVIIALSAQFFQAAPWLVVVFGAALAAGNYLSKLRKSRLEAKTIARLGDEPLGNILDPNRALTANSARMLAGNTSFDFEVVGENLYAQNFAALQKNLGLVDGQDWDDVAALVAEPSNPQSQNLVAVFVSGLRVGYVPDTRSAGIFRFLLQNGGYARADAAIYFSLKDGQSCIWLDVALPYSFRP